MRFVRALIRIEKLETSVISEESRDTGEEECGNSDLISGCVKV